MEMEGAPSGLLQTVARNLSFPVPEDWENRITEGKVEQYYETTTDVAGTKDLWDYTDLPLWMKGEYMYKSA